MAKKERCLPQNPNRAKARFIIVKLFDTWRRRTRGASMRRLIDLPVKPVLHSLFTGRSLALKLMNSSVSGILRRKLLKAEHLSSKHNFRFYRTQPHEE
jgi:hypothetical protein